jgi:hypothetical protein
MARVTRPWIELNYETSGSLRAEDIPFSVSESIKDALRSSVIINQSTVPGYTITDALNELSGSNGAGVTKDGIDVANSFVSGDVIRRTLTGFSKSQANSVSNAEVLGIVEFATTSSFSVVYSGKVYVTGHGFTLGSPLYLSQGTAGAITDVEPTSGISKPIGVAISADEIVVGLMRGFDLDAVGSGSGGGGGGSGGGGIQSQQCYITSGSETTIPLNPSVNVDESLVFLNGIKLTTSDYSLTSNYLSLVTASLTNDEICVIDYGTAAAGGGVSTANEQCYSPASPQTVFPLSPNVNTAATLVYINGVRIPTTDYTLTTSQLTTDYAIPSGSDVCVVDFIGGGTSGSAVTTFTGLTDTPNSYIGHANKFVIVNSSGTALTFISTASFAGSGSGGVISTPATASSNNGELIVQSNTFSVGQPVYLSSSLWVTSSVTFNETSEVLGVVSSATSTNFQIVYNGVANIPSHGFGSAGEILFLAPAGSLTTTSPTSGISKPVATVKDANNLIVYNMRGINIGGETEINNIKVMSGSFAAVKDTTYYITGSNVTASLPTNPGNGALFEFNDYEGDWGINNVAVVSAATITGVTSQPLVLDKNFGSVKLRFFNSKYRFEA